MNVSVKSPKPPTEAAIQLKLCSYIRENYPFAIFNSDGAGNNVSKAQAGINKMLRSGSGYPDLFIAEPKGQYRGMFLELKREGTIIYKKDGELTTNEHIRIQAEMLNELCSRGYWADFAVGLDQAIELVDAYFSGQV